MLTVRFVAAMIAASLMVLGADVAWGQSFPVKPIRVVSASAGGSSDVVVRMVAPGVSEILGQPVIVDNRAGGTVTGEIVARATPDGYTLLIVGGSFWIAPFLQKTNYDPVGDFSPVSLLVSAPSILVTHPELGVTSVKDLIALAKAKPGALNYAEPGTGGGPHLAAELFKAMAGLNIVRISYSGASQALIDLMGGRVQVMFPIASSVAPYVKTGRLKALAVTSAQPSVLAPGLPTMAASGLPGYEVTSPQGIYAPAKTPAPIVTQLSRDFALVLNKPEMKERLLNSGSEVVGSTPDELGAYMKSDMARMGKVIKDAGIKAD